MRLRSRIMTAAAVSVAFIGGAYAAEQSATAPSAQAADQAAADRDVGKLSKDGAAAYRDLRMTRLAIFNANPSEAKTLIAKAQAELDKAKTDDAIFTKAEADLKQPGTPGAAAPNTATAVPPSNAADPKTADTKTTDTKTAATTAPVAWLPVDGQLSLDDDFVATPTKSAAVDEANKSLSKGDRKGALEKLKLADVNVSFTMAVMPLATTTSDVDKAATLIGEGKYYEANSVLKQAEDGMHFDIVDMNDMPKAKQAQQTTPDVKTAPASKTTK